MKFSAELLFDQVSSFYKRCSPLQRAKALRAFEDRSDRNLFASRRRTFAKPLETISSPIPYLNGAFVGGWFRLSESAEGAITPET